MRSRFATPDLLEEFPDLNAPDVVVTKELYAHFGLLFYTFSLLEHTLINAVAFSRAFEQARRSRIKRQAEWEPLVDKGFAFAKGLTFGKLVNEVAKVQEFSNVVTELREIKRHRDYFAHHFFREDIAFFGSEEGSWHLLSKLNATRKDVKQVEELADGRFHDMLARFGFPRTSAEEIEKWTTEMLDRSRLDLVAGSSKVGWERDDAL
jgi:hypothetical protein